MPSSRSKSRDKKQSKWLKMNGCKYELITDFREENTDTVDPISGYPEFLFFLVYSAVSSSGPLAPWK